MRSEPPKAPLTQPFHNKKGLYNVHNCRDGGSRHAVPISEIGHTNATLIFLHNFLLLFDCDCFLYLLFLR
jgi:hypothetical protein